MLKFSRRNKKLVIPVGINPNYNIEVKDLYTTKDADVVANDVIAGKIAYGSEGKIVGTLDIESEIATSFENGYAAGQEYGYESGYGVGREEGFDAGIEDQKAKLETITITENGTYNREDGYNEVIVEVPDLNGDYNEGYSEGYGAGESAGYNNGYNNGYNEGNQDGYDNGYRVGNTDGIAIGREEIITEQNDANITSTDVVEGKIGYSKNNTKIVGNLNIQTIKDASYNQGYSEGYGAGESAGIEEGKQEIISGMDDATITPLTVIKGEIGYGKNNEKIIGEFEFVEGFNFGKIGYSQTESNECNDSLNDAIVYSKTLLDSWNENDKPNLETFFKSNKNLVYAPNIDVEKNTNKLAQNAFSGCTNLIYVPRLNTNKITNMSNMFNGCSLLTSVPLFDTSNVTDMSYMFSSCSNLTSVPQFDTSNVTKMDHMFYSANTITTVPDFNTPNVKDFSYMFTTFGSGILEKAPNFNMISATNVRNMFQNQKKITSIPEYDLSNVVTLGPFLYGCSGLTSVPNFNTSKATNYSETFSGCTELTTIGILDMSSATEVKGTFDKCKKLANINGMLNLGKGYLMTQTTSYHNLSLSNSPLTRESCLKIFNDIYDLNLKSDYTISPTIQLSSTTKALLSADDIAIATSKGWTIS